ncbi:Hypothetical predicted protein [Mytilus galloprovincialis]|nr:Hypothetical predicted protein [Mytilus galloprovincialis]
MFYFAHCLLNWQNLAWKNLTDNLFPCLLEDYLNYFLPLNKSTLPPVPHQQSPIRSPVIHSKMYSPGSKTNTSPRTFGLLKASFIASQKQHSQNSSVLGQSEAEVWRSETLLQIFIEFWLNQNAIDSEKSMISPTHMEHFMPSLEHVRLVRMMIKHVHHFVNTASHDVIPSPNQTHPMSPLDEFKRSIIPNMLQKNMYAFLRHSFDRWPLDNSFRMVLETWLTYIQPWRYTSRLPSTGKDSEGDTKLVEKKRFTFIEDNLLFYSVLLQEFFNRVKRMDLMNLANSHMLYRVAKVFRLENLDSMLRQAEQKMCTSIYRSSGHMTRALGGSYLPPESSLMFHSQISDLEKPGFQYTLMFGEKTLYSVKQVLQQLQEVKTQIQYQLDSKPVKSGLAGFFSSLFDDNFVGIGDLTPNDVKKQHKFLDEYLDDTCPDITETCNRVSLTDIGRYQVINKMKRFEVMYSGDPDLQPIRSFENATTVRLLHQFCSYINTQFSNEIQTVYERTDLIGRLAQVYFAPVIPRDKKPSSPISGKNLDELRRPKLRLRFLASYSTMLYLAILFVFLNVWLGVGPLQYKSTEHVLGCVLCSPGCFSLFRGSALMDDNIMRKYTIKPTEASHHLMYDQGEDRWLCTLLLQQGYRVDYAAASDAYTYAPEGFGEFFNQRRRWMPSTIANIMDLLADASNTVSINNNISWLYMFYQGALMVSTLIGPSTVIMMIAGSYLTVFKLDLLTSYAIALTPAFVYTILCFTVKTKYQIMVAEILSAVYSFIMMVVFVGCIITAVRESPFHPSVIFLAAMVFIFLFAAVLHPWEFSCIIYGALYFLCVPSGFLLLVIYSLVNMNIVSWGTREVPKKKTKAEIEEEERKRKEKEEKKKQGWFSRFMPKFQLQDLKGLMDMTRKEDKSVVLLEQMNKNMEMFMKLQGKSGALLEEVKVDEIKPPKQRKSVTFASDSDSDEETKEKRTKEDEYIYQKEKKQRNDLKNPKWLELKEFQFGHTMQMNKEEIDFWHSFIGKYLEPLEANKDEQKKVAKELAELRNNVAAGFAFINLIWVAINFMFQLRKPAVITFPSATGADDVDEDNIKIDALGLMFVVFFVVILTIQFIGMIVHRWGTFMHLIAITEIPNPCKKDIDEQVRDSKDKQKNARDMIRLCEEIVGEPMPDYPSDEEDENSREREREEVLRMKIENNATQGVSENLRESIRNPGIGKSLRNTRVGNIGSTRTRLGETVREGNFQRVAKTILARTQREVNNSEESGFKPNNVRKRGKSNQDTNQKNNEHVRKFGHNTPVFSDFMEKVNDRKLNTLVDGADRNGGNLGLGATYNPRNASMDDEESIYDEIPGAGTLGRAFNKKIQKMAKTGVRPSDRNGPLQYSNNIEMHHRDVERGNRL